MSWSFGFTCKNTQTDFDSVSKQAVAQYTDEQAGYNNPVTAETEESIDAALVAARALIASKALGKNTVNVNVTLGGHSNPNHEPAAGWANDQINVSVAQVV